jgi:hypothetical protein
MSIPFIVNLSQTKKAFENTYYRFRLLLESLSKNYIYKKNIVYKVFYIQDVSRKLQRHIGKG